MFSDGRKEGRKTTRKGQKSKESTSSNFKAPPIQSPWPGGLSGNEQLKAVKSTCASERSFGNVLTFKSLYIYYLY